MRVNVVRGVPLNWYTYLPMFLYSVPCECARVCVCAHKVRTVQRTFRLSSYRMLTRAATFRDRPATLSYCCTAVECRTFTVVQLYIGTHLVLYAACGFVVTSLPSLNTINNNIKKKKNTKN